MFLRSLLLAVAFLASNHCTAQISLKAGEVYFFSYRLLPPPPGNPCEAGAMGNMAGIELQLDAESVQPDDTLRIEISDFGSTDWTGTNTTASLHLPGSRYPSGGQVRCLKGEVVISRVSLPWALYQQNVITKQFERCPMDGVPFVPKLQLFCRGIMGDQLMLNWTTNAPDHELVLSTSLSTGTWSAVTNPITRIGSYFSVQVDATPGQKFFRLRKL